MKYKRVIILILFLPLILNSKVLEFYDGFMYSELKSRYSANTNFPNKLNEVFQQIEMKLRLNITSKLEGYAFFKTEYCQFHWKKEDRLFFLNSMGVKYKINPVTEIKLGSMSINYSPYVIFAYPWFTDIFRGLEFKIDRSDLTFQTFIANNGEDPDESLWLQDNPDVNTNINFDYSTINLGYDEKGVKQEHPTIWGGIYLRKSLERNEFLTPEFKLYYLYENYQIEDTQAWAEVHKNHIVGSEANLLFFNWIDLDIFGAVSLNQKDIYTINTNYFGSNRDFYQFKETQKEKYPDAIAVSAEIKDFWGRFLGTHNLKLKYRYESVDAEFNPRYMQGNLVDTRTVNPEKFVYNGRKGFSLVLMQDLIMGLSAGYGYSKYTYNRSSRFNFATGATIIENSIRVSLVLSKMFRLHFIYLFNSIKDGFFPDGSNKIDSYYILFEGDIIDNLFVAIEYGKDWNYYKDYSQLMVKFMMWGW